MPANIMQFNSYTEAFALQFTDVWEDSLAVLPRSYAAFLKEETAKRWVDTDWVVSGLGAMPEKSIGAAVTTDKIIKGPTKQYSLKAYALGCVIEWEAMRWDWYGVFEGLPEELARAATDRYNIVGHSVLNNSFAAPDARFQNYRSENMLSTTHARLDGGTWTNLSSTNVGLSYLGIQQAFIDLRKTPGERGRYNAAFQPRLLITSVEQKWIADEILGSTWRPDTANQNKNLLRGDLDTYDSPYFTTPQYWWVECDKKKVNIRMRLGEKPRLTKDTEPRTLSLLMHTYCSFDVAIFDTRGLWGSTGGA